MRQLPVKFRTLQVIAQNEGIANDEIVAKLQEEYPADRFVSSRGIATYLLALKAVGLIEPISITLTPAGELKQCYKITDYGAARMKYINKR